MTSEPTATTKGARTAPPRRTGTSEQRAKLNAALHAAQVAVGAVQKSGTSERGHSTSEVNEIIEAAKFALNAQGLTLQPLEGKVEAIGTRLEPLDGGRTREVPQLFLRKRWLLTHDEGGEREYALGEWPITPDPGHSLSEARAATDSMSLKYFLRELLLIAQHEPEKKKTATERARDRRAAAIAPQATRREPEDHVAAYADACDACTDALELTDRLDPKRLTTKLPPALREVAAAYAAFTASRISGRSWEATTADVEAVTNTCAYREVQPHWERPGTQTPAPTITDAPAGAEQA